MLGLLLAGCTSAGSRRPDAAPRATARGAEILVHAAGRAHYFENRRPHCLAYALAGDWEFAVQPAALRSTDRRRFVGVVLQSGDALPGPARGDLVARAIAQIIVDTEQDWGGSVLARVEPFSSVRVGAVLVEFDESAPTGARRAVPGRARPPLRVIAPFDADLVMVVTTLEVADALEVFRTLEVTEDPQCWRRTINERFPGALR